MFSQNIRAICVIALTLLVFCSVAGQAKDGDFKTCADLLGGKSCDQIDPGTSLFKTCCPTGMANPAMRRSDPSAKLNAGGAAIAAAAKKSGKPTASDYVSCLSALIGRNSNVPEEKLTRIEEPLGVEPATILLRKTLPERFFVCYESGCVNIDRHVLYTKKRKMNAGSGYPTDEYEILLRLPERKEPVCFRLLAEEGATLLNCKKPPAIGFITVGPSDYSYNSQLDAETTELMDNFGKSLWKESGPRMPGPRFLDDQETQLEKAKKWISKAEKCRNTPAFGSFTKKTDEQIAAARKFARDLEAQLKPFGIPADNSGSTAPGKATGAQ